MWVAGALNILADHPLKGRRCVRTASQPRPLAASPKAVLVKILYQDTSYNYFGQIRLLETGKSLRKMYLDRASNCRYCIWLQVMYLYASSCPALTAGNESAAWQDTPFPYLDSRWLLKGGPRHPPWFWPNQGPTYCVLIRSCMPDQ